MNLFRVDFTRPRTGALWSVSAAGDPARERLVRGVITEESKPGLEALRAASPVIRHERSSQLVIAAILGCRFMSSKPTTTIVSTVAGRPGFPGRRTGAPGRVARRAMRRRSDSSRNDIE
jgi:hypothetical protein